MPTYVYSYGCKPPTAEQAAYIDGQIALAHRYYNDRIEIERELFFDLEKIEKSHSSELEKAIELRENSNSAIEGLYDQVRSRNSKSRSKLPLTDAEVSALTALRQQRREAWTLIKELRAAVRKLPEFQEQKAGRIQQYYEKKKELYNSYSGLWWGTKSKVEQAVEQAVRKTKHGPPRFARWERDGLVASQIQKGITPSQLFSCTDTRVQAEPAPTKRTGKTARPYAFRLRVGSIGRDPKWVQVYMYYHRQLPENCKIMWVVLVRRNGPRYRQSDGTWKHQDQWSVQLTIRTEEPIKKRAASGMVGVDLGWRLMAGRSLRVASWKADDGKQGELRLPATLLARWHKSRDLQAIRDLIFNEIRDEVSAYCQQIKNKPEWLATLSENIELWRSHERLIKLLEGWQRHPGDTSVYTHLAAWRERESHLEQYQVNNQLKAERIRKDLYRCFAAKLARQYETIFVEDCDLSQLARVPPPDMQAEYGVREYRSIAAPGALRDILKQSGALVIEAPAEHTTSTCHGCGSIEEFDRHQLTHACQKCNLVWDQDYNAACNLLASGGGAGKTPGPARGTEGPTGSQVATSQGVSNRWKKRKELARSKNESQGQS